jgi:hypothetical protein
MTLLIIFLEEVSLIRVMIEEAWDLLNTISENTDNWDFEKGNKARLEYEYSCVENFSTSIYLKN